MSSERAIDWKSVHERLEAVRAMVAQGPMPSPEEQKRLLKARARELARERSAPPKPRDLLEIVEFELGRERYGLPLASVREVLALNALTPVPCTPAFILGIINVRGEIRTVIDLGRFFDLPGRSLTESNKIILAERGDLQLGILADAIRGAKPVPRNALQTALPTLTDRRADYLLGLTPDRIAILDPARLLSDPRILIDHEMPASPDAPASRS